MRMIAASIAAAITAIIIIAARKAISKILQLN